jgi:hypothetical protein
MGTRGFFLGVKRPRPEADHSSPNNMDLYILIQGVDRWNLGLIIEYGH